MVKTPAVVSVGNFNTGFNHGKNNFLRGAADSKVPRTAEAISGTGSAGLL